VTELGEKVFDIRVLLDENIPMEIHVDVKKSVFEIYTLSSISGDNNARHRVLRIYGYLETAA
jgi:hypothetical protein